RRAAPDVSSPQAARIAEPRRGALPVGATGRPDTGFGTRVDPGEVDDRSIYRRDDAGPRRPGDPTPVTPELVDGVPVYKIYRPRAARTGGDRAD
ncbi:hypothetical protein GTW08_21430, partial [Pseudonocardia sp. SID8383]|nr:hypothetical protein [Pseudonocardia sp. SID8383]